MDEAVDVSSDTQPAYAEYALGSGAEYDLASRACSGGLPANKRSLLIFVLDLICPQINMNDGIASDNILP